MAAKVPRSSAPSPDRALDPVAILRRDNTLLEILAGGFRRLAEAIGQGGPAEEKKIAEALEIHRLFLVEIHHTMMEMVDGAMDKIAGSPLKGARAECRKEHEAARAASERLARDFQTFKTDASKAKAQFKQDLIAETDRWTAHAREEEENLFSQLPESFRRETKEAVGDVVHRFRAESASVEERLTSWASTWGAASD